jgi:hypothetical protein
VRVRVGDGGDEDDAMKVRMRQDSERIWCIKNRRASGRS